MMSCGLWCRELEVCDTRDGEGKKNKKNPEKKSVMAGGRTNWTGMRQHLILRLPWLRVDAVHGISNTYSATVSVPQLYSPCQKIVYDNYTIKNTSLNNLFNHLV